MWQVRYNWNHCHQEEQRSSTHKGEHFVYCNCVNLLFHIFLTLTGDFETWTRPHLFSPMMAPLQTCETSHTIIHTSCTCSFRNMLLVACCLNKFSLSLKLQMSADNLACPSSNFPSHQLAHQCSPNIIGIWEWSICGLMGGAFMAYWVGHLWLNGGAFI